MELRYFRFEGLLQREGWLSPAYVGVDHDGKIQYLSNKPHPDGSAIESVIGYALPGFQNAHSHAFQYAMAGLAETHPGSGQDDFWSWREEMYKCALTVGPEDVESIAAMLYSEMARHGYTHVAEFHYLHHDIDGRNYDHLAEMGERVVAAAGLAGIKITLVPVFYQRGGFGQDPQARQRRFISSTVEKYLELLEASRVVVRNNSHARLGVSVHSLRGVEPSDAKVVVASTDRKLPFHIHVAEQKKEVADCLQYTGKRPMQWLLDNIEIDSRCHLVHATHLDDQELVSVAASGAQVVLCPSTEGNLGDGFFRMKEYYAEGGHWSIGTDSHIGLNPFEEFRMIDYRQRLLTNQRNTFNGDAARYLIDEEIISGRKAMGLDAKDHFVLGESFDALILDAKAPLLLEASLNHILPAMVYGGDVAYHLGTIIDGKWIVRQQHHKAGHAIRERFVKTIRKLGSR